jgi:hypothetical protein
MYTPPLIFVFLSNKSVRARNVACNSLLGDKEHNGGPLVRVEDPYAGLVAVCNSLIPEKQRLPLDAVKFSKSSSSALGSGAYGDVREGALILTDGESRRVAVKGVSRVEEGGPKNVPPECLIGSRNTNKRIKEITVLWVEKYVMSCFLCCFCYVSQDCVILNRCIKELEVSVHLAAKGAAMHCYGGVFTHKVGATSGKRGKGCVEEQARAPVEKTDHMFFYIVYDVAKYNLHNHVARLRSAWSAPGNTVAPGDIWIEKLRIMAQLARCVRALDQCSLAHSDLKPNNVLVTDTDDVKVGAIMCQLLLSSV